MSDILADPAKCRNIAVDIRYVCSSLTSSRGQAPGGRDGAESDAEAMRTIELPIHR